MTRREQNRTHNRERYQRDAAHRQRVLAYRHNRYWIRRNLGLCVWCGTPCAPKCMCDGCREKHENRKINRILREVA